MLAKPVMFATLAKSAVSAKSVMLARSAVSAMLVMFF